MIVNIVYEKSSDAEAIESEVIRSDNDFREGEKIQLHGLTYVITNVLHLTNALNDSNMTITVKQEEQFLNG